MRILYLPADGRCALTPHPILSLVDRGAETAQANTLGGLGDARQAGPTSAIYDEAFVIANDMDEF
jgi:hypothetical protein